MTEKSRAHTAHHSVETYQQSESLGFLLHQAKLRLHQAIDERVGQLDITAAQWVVLKQIALRNGETASALCRDIGCDTGSMTRMLDRLEARGLIRRERSTTDRRVVQLLITDAGSSLLPEVVPRVVDVLNRAVQDFSDEEFAQLKNLLRRLNANLDRSNP